MEHAAVREARALVHDVEHADMLHRMGHELPAAFGDVEQSFIGREGEPVRSLEIIGGDRERPVARIETVERRRQFRRLLAAFVIGVDAVLRVAEPDRAVRFADDVIRRIEPPVVVTIGQDREAAV